MSNKKSITPKHLNDYANMSLSEIESQAELIHSQPPSSEAQLAYRIARQALSLRQREIKSIATNFEITNQQHLLFYSSTAGFTKMIGHSVLFFSQTIANRIHWRFTIKSDSDHYFPSEEGVISFRSMDKITELLQRIGIMPDSKISTDELHYFTLPKIYTDHDIANFRDIATNEANRISSIVLPHSPNPMLYDAISKTAHLLYYEFKHLSDPFARESIGLELVKDSRALSINYLSYANSAHQEHRQYLINIVRLSRTIQYSLAYASKLNLLHHRDICKILEQLTITERLAKHALTSK